MNYLSDAREIFELFYVKKNSKLFLFTSNKGVKKCPHLYKAVKLNNLQNKIPHTTLGQCLVSSIILLCFKKIKKTHKTKNCFAHWYYGGVE